MIDRAEIERAIGRISKLKSLAECGIGGERENARELLETVAKKYGIDLDNLPGTEEEREFPLAFRKGWRVHLFSQILGVMREEQYGDISAPHCALFERRARGGRKGYCFVKCTALQWAEASAKFAVLSRDYEDQLGAFFRAFLYAKRLACEWKAGAETDGKGIGGRAACDAGCGGNQKERGTQANRSPARSLIRGGEKGEKHG